MRALKTIHRVHFDSHEPLGADPGLEQRSQRRGWARTWRRQAEQAWVPACLCGRDCASRRCCLVFCGRLWRMARASLKHMGLLSSSPPRYAPPDPVRLEINPGEPPYGVLSPLCVVLTKLRWLGWSENMWICRSSHSYIATATMDVKRFGHLLAILFASFYVFTI